MKKILLVFCFFPLLIIGSFVSQAASTSIPKIPPSVSALSQTKLIYIKPATVLTVQMNKPDGSVYKGGENIWFRVKNTVNGYLYILDIPPEGTITQIFPNYYQPNNFIKVGTHRIPSSLKYKFVVSGKYPGLEFVEFILSSKPLSFLQSTQKTKSHPFPAVGKVSKKELAKFKLNMMKSLMIVPKKWTAWTYFYVNNGNVKTLLKITSVPSNARVMIDNKYYGITPTVVNISPGYHEISIERNGYKTWKGIVYVEFGKTKTIDVNLIPNEQNLVGTLRIRVSPSDSEVYLDGIKVGKGDQILKVSAGYHSVEVKHENYQTYYNDSVRIDSNKTTTLNVKLVPLEANIYIHSQPYVSVYIDDVFAGGTGYDGVLYLQGVKIGYHKIRFSKEWYIKQTINYEVSPGDNYVSITLNAAGMLKVNSNIYPISVKVDGKDAGKIENSDEGLYVPIGSHRITFSNPEYLSKTEILNFSFQKITRINLSMNLKPLSMDVKVSPNPFSPNGDWYEDTTNFYITLSRRGRVKVEIYSGDKMIWYRELDASYGTTTVTWDGNSIDGIAMPNGIYKVVFTVNSYGKNMTKSLNVVINKNGYTYLKQIIIIGGIALLVGILYLLLK